MSHKNEESYGRTEDVSLELDPTRSRYEENITHSKHTGNGIINRQPTGGAFHPSRKLTPAVGAIAQPAVMQVSSISYPLPLRSGLEILDDAHRLIIQQSVGVADLEYMSSENRYTVKTSRGDTIAYATESSDSWQRKCFGSGRSFSMRLYDKTQKEVLYFKRRLACGNCTFWCYLQKLEVWKSPGELLGTVSQSMSLLLKTVFNVCDHKNNLVYVIEGPSTFGCLLGKSQHFQIFNVGTTKVGSIVFQFDHLQVANYLLISMPENIQDSHHKALLLGSAFLLEYMFFESMKKKSCNRCCF